MNTEMNELEISKIYESSGLSCIDDVDTENILKFVSSKMILDEEFNLLIGQVLYNHHRNKEDSYDAWKDFLIKICKKEVERLHEGDNEFIYIFPDYIGNIDRLDGYLKDFLNRFSENDYTEHSWSSISFYIRFILKDEEYIKKYSDESMIMGYFNPPNHMKIANYLYISHKDYIKSESKKFYTFDTRLNTWIESGCEFTTSKLFDLTKKLVLKRVKLQKLIIESHDESFRERFEVVVKQMTSAIDFIGKQEHIDKIHRNLANRVMDRSFSKKFDKYINFTGVKNGVLIAYGDKIIFRKSVPEDFLSKQFNASFSKTVDADKYEKLSSWFNKLFPDKDYYDYIIKILASLLISGNLDKNFFILSGQTGHNGKSTFVTLIEGLLGLKIYASKVGTNLFTRPLNASHQANSSLCDLAENRFCSCDEPEATELLISANVKSVSGNDTTPARRLNKESKNSKIQSIVFMTCNRTPSFKDPDQAIYERVRILPFITQWSTNPPKSIEKQIAKRHYQVDKSFLHNVPSLSGELLRLMVEYWPRYYHEKLDNIPKAVESAINDYWNETDYFLEWSKNFELTKDKENEVLISDTYADFMVFFRNKYIGRTCPCEVDYIHGMRKHLRRNKVDGTKWIKIKYNKPIYEDENRNPTSSQATFKFVKSAPTK